MRAFVGLGSNLEYAGMEPAALLDAAVDALRVAGMVRTQSSVYRTEPVGFSQQPAFLNAAVMLETELGPLELLHVLLGIERQFGRDRAMSVRNGPRTLDLDLLLYGEAVMVTGELILPHPRLAERRFVLTPLAEIAPTMVHPVRQRTMRELLELLPKDGENGADAVRRVSPSGEADG